MEPVMNINELIVTIVQFCNPTSLVTLFNTSKQFRSAVVQCLSISPCNIVETIAHSGCLIMLKHVRSLNYPLSEKIMNIAAQYDDLIMMKWLHSHNILPDQKTWRLTTKYGYLDILQWLFPLKYPSSMHDHYDAWNVAAEYGHLHILKWGEEAGFLNFKSDLYCHAIAKGQLEIIKWLYEQGQKLYCDLYCHALQYKRWEIIAWLHVNECPWKSNKSINFMRAAIITGNRDNVRLVYEITKEFSNCDYHYAISSKIPEVIEEANSIWTDHYGIMNS